jgi:8-oxo-dGTP pyrophosphatase MutT (NUDIX family)
MVWKPHVTVSAVCERRDRFLVVEERVRGRLVVNNPAGHLEDDESLIEAVLRETLEETGWEFAPEFVTGLYLWKSPSSAKTFLRVNFFGHAMRHHPAHALDRGIVRALWMSRDELAGCGRLRSPLVLRCVDDYLAGKHYPLDVLSHLEEMGSDHS